MPNSDTKIRYVARWMSVQYGDPETGDGDPDRDEYRRKVRPTLDEAGRYGCKKNCYGSECFVIVQEWEISADILEHEGRTVWQWQDVEEWLFQDGQCVEQIRYD